MKATIFIPGDISAGIHPTSVTIDGLPDDDHREDNRNLLAGCFAGIFDNGGVDVFFEDECIDCGQRGSHSRDCPTCEIDQWCPSA